MNNRVVFDQGNDQRNKQFENIQILSVVEKTFELLKFPRFLNNLAGSFNSQRKHSAKQKTAGLRFCSSYSVFLQQCFMFSRRVIDCTRNSRKVHEFPSVLCPVHRFCSKAISLQSCNWKIGEKFFLRKIFQTIESLCIRDRDNLRHDVCATLQTSRVFNLRHVKQCRCMLKGSLKKICFSPCWDQRTEFGLPMRRFQQRKISFVAQIICFWFRFLIYQMLQRLFV